jgi:hypothetical protein
MEEFEELKDFPNYKINRKGEIWSNCCERIMDPSLNKDGYYIISLTKDGKQYTKLVHRLIAIQFIDNPNNLPEIDHIDHNRTNNSLENLRWVSRIENNNNRIVRGCIYWHKTHNNWQAQITIFGKTYSKSSKEKSVVEEWLKKIKIDLKNNVFEDIPKKERGCIYWNTSHNNWQAQITIFGKTYSKQSKEKSVVEEWLKNIKIENKLN